MVCCSAWGQGANIDLHDHINGAKNGNCNPRHDILSCNSAVKASCSPTNSLLFLQPFDWWENGWKLGSAHICLQHIVHLPIFSLFLSLKLILTSQTFALILLQGIGCWGRGDSLMWPEGGQREVTDRDVGKDVSGNRGPVVGEIPGKATDLNYR